MILTAFVLLALSAFVTAIAHAIWKVPLWVPVILLSLYALLQQIPLGR